MTELRDIVAPLLEWYRENARVLPWRESSDPYRVWVSEIMLQQTRVETAIPYYERFLRRLPTVQSLAEIDEETLFKLWEGLGYYSRARNLQKAARVICEQYGGIFPRERAALLALPGIGDYTAGAVLSIAFGLPAAAVDGNVLRVLSRLTEDAGSIADPALRRRYAEALEAVYPPGSCGDFTQSLMELGAVVCLPNGTPRCEVCPLAKQCCACRSGTQMQYPVKPPKPARPMQQKTLFLLACGDRMALQKRPEGGLLGGLWAFPTVEGELTPQQARDWLAEAGVTVLSLGEPAEKKHIFTHVEWRMRAYPVLCAAQAQGFVWLTRTELEEQAMLPTAFRKFLPCCPPTDE